MKLNEVIRVNAHYTRAASLERDQNETSHKNYIPTAKTLKVLKRIADTLGKKNQPRAWSIVGPYGSGKSSLGLFASALLSPAKSHAIGLLKQYEAALAAKFSRINALPVRLTGSPEPLGKRLISALKSAIENDGKRKTAKQKRLLAHLAGLEQRKELTTSEVLEAFEKGLLYSESSGFNGLFIVIDELGKFLEYEARHYSANEIFLLQSLAERSLVGGKANLFLLVLLHKSIDQYAQGLGESLKQEWSKIQGRFEEVPFIESPEQTLRVIGTAIKKDLPSKKMQEIAGNLTQISSKLTSHLNLAKEIPDRNFLDCYPLHPLTAYLLPQLCSKISQNERTLFSFLGSEEESGFQDLLRHRRVGEYILPHDVYDYFVSNQSGSLGDHLTHRRWIEVVTAVERAASDDPEVIQLLKTIGLFNIIASQGRFKASPEILNTVFPGGDLQNLLKILESQSLIIYRKYSGEYRIWQGSDFDMDGAIQKAISSLGNFSVAEELNQSNALNPIVARKQTAETGALRYFLPVFVDSETTQRISTESMEPRIFFFLGFGRGDKKVFRSLSKVNNADLLVYCESPQQLRNAVIESIALSKIQMEASDLNQDPVAKREFSERIRIAKSVEKELLANLISDTSANEWYFRCKKLKPKGKKGFQHTLSIVLEQLFPHTPIFKNELINRDRMSAQAVAARTKLMEAMLLRSDQFDLGIEKFPAEKAMYRAVLRAPGVHKKVNGVYRFKKPPRSNTQLTAVWNEIEKFIKTTENEAKSLIDLNPILLAPPYGLKAGILPVLYLAYYLANEHELAVFESRRYCPSISPEMMERFVKRPDDFTFQLFRIKGLRASLFKQYSLALFDHEDARNILDVARPLARFMGQLPEYTKKTRRGLSSETLALRNAFNLSKSPEHLLFEKLPEALGFETFSDEIITKKQLPAFAESLRVCLSELKNCYSELLNEQKNILAQALNQHPDESLEEIRNYAKHWYGLDKYTADGKELGAFLSRLTKTNGDAKQWLENILMFLVHKEPKNWADADRDEAEFRLRKLTSRTLELQKIKLEEDKFKGIDDNYDFYLLKTVKKGEQGRDVVVSINQTMEKRIEATYHSIKDQMLAQFNTDQQLAILAKLSNEFLSKKASMAKPKLKVVKKNE